MFPIELEELVNATLVDGVLTDTERRVLIKKAQSMGLDSEEFEILLDARVAKMQQEKAANNTKERSAKVGELRKCPACGALISGLVAKCPECGYEFNHVEVNSALKEFVGKVEDANNRMKESSSIGSVFSKAMGLSSKMSPVELVISTYPVPSSAVDLLEFLTYLQGCARRHAVGTLNVESDGRIEHAYWILYDKCISKAKVMFAYDERFTPFFQHHKKVSRSMTPELKTFLGAIGALVALLALSMSLAFLCD